MIVDWRLEVRNKAPIVLCELLFNDKIYMQLISEFTIFSLTFRSDNLRLRACSSIKLAKAFAILAAKWHHDQVIILLLRDT